MISAQKFSELLAALHSAPLREANWQLFLTTLCQTTIAAHGACIAIDVKRNQPTILAQGGVEYIPEVQDAYNRHYSGLDPYAQPFLKSRNGVVCGEELVALAVLCATMPLIVSALSWGQKILFPPTDQKNFTARSLTVREVNIFLKQLGGNHPNRVWEVQGIQCAFQSENQFARTRAQEWLNIQKGAHVYGAQLEFGVCNARASGLSGV